MERRFPIQPSRICCLKKSPSSRPHKSGRASVCTFRFFEDLVLNIQSYIDHISAKGCCMQHEPLRRRQCLWSPHSAYRTRALILASPRYSPSFMIIAVRATSPEFCSHVRLFSVQAILVWCPACDQVCWLKVQVEPFEAHERLWMLQHNVTPTSTAR